MTGDKEAARIFQTVLDGSGRAMLAGDVDAILPWFAIPNTVENLEGRRVLASEEETRTLFEDVIANQRAQCITDMVRRVTHAEFKDPDTIWAIHETRYIYHGKILSDKPHEGFSIVKRVGSQWKVSHAQFTVRGDNPLSRSMARGAPRSRT